MSSYPDLSRLWTSRRALEHARAEALRIARSRVNPGGKNHDGLEQRGRDQIRFSRKGAKTQREERESSQEATFLDDSSAYQAAGRDQDAEENSDPGRRRDARAAGQVMNAHHQGVEHLDFFRDQIEPILRDLAAGFHALEIGAGMAWHAALVASRQAGRVLATEVLWDRETPFSLANVHTLYRLARQDAVLEAALQFERDADGHLTALRFPPTLSFLRASADRLPLREASLDFLYSYNCLEHLPDLERAFAECARVLRVGGILYASAQPFFYSAGGHHLDDILPVPWGHLLWEPEELADVVVREVGPGREWSPGEPLQPRHIVGILRDELNHARPGAFRRALRAGPWAVDGWIDLTHPDDERLAEEIGLRDALRGVPAEALFLRGVRFRLRRARRPEGLRAPFRMSHRLRAALRFRKSGG